MLDYPNMSYCQFGNTQLALDQVIGTIQDVLEMKPAAQREWFADLSMDERRAMSYLTQLAHNYLELAEELFEAAAEDCEPNL